jgi:integrase
MDTFGENWGYRLFMATAATHPEYFGRRSPKTRTSDVWEMADGRWAWEVGPFPLPGGGVFRKHGARQTQKKAISSRDRAYEAYNLVVDPPPAPPAPVERELTAAEKWTVEEWCEHAIDRIAKERASRTPQGYRYSLKNWVYPAVGQTRLADLNNWMLQDFIDSIPTRSTQAAVKTALSSCLAKAVRARILSFNPVHGLTLKKRPKRHEEDEERPDKRLLTESEKAALLRALSRTPREVPHDVSTPDGLVAAANAIYSGRIESAWSLAFLPCALSLYLGLRLGEALGARWSDIDWQEELPAEKRRPKIKIQRQVQRIVGVGLEADLPLKSNSAYRTLGIPPQLALILQEARRQTELRKRELEEEGVTLPASAFSHICHQRGRGGRSKNVGGPLDPSNVEREFRKEVAKIIVERKNGEPVFLNRKGVAPVKIHTLRSNFLSFWANVKRISDTELQKIAGHADVATTKRWYVVVDDTKVADLMCDG